MFKIINSLLNTKFTKSKNLRIYCISVFIILFVTFFVIFYQAIYTKTNPRETKLDREVENTKNKIVNEVTELYPIKVIDIVTPHTTEEISEYVKRYDHISIGGGRNSMGGQTASEKAVQIDMREFNKILNISTSTKEITVQTGARWRDIQDYIDPYNLSVKIMQTYSNFTVGGSLSVNVHGRYVGLGPIILSVKNIKVVLADGSIVTASPTENSDIFFSAIGGYGGIGVISEATLYLADNVNVERSRVKMPIGQYAEYFKNTVKASSSKILFHNGDIYPNDFDSVSAVSWKEVPAVKNITTENRLIPRGNDYWLERFVWVTMSEWPMGKWIREYAIEPLLYSGKPPVHTRNYEASYDIMELEPESRASSTYVLQEYFVPVENFDTWIPKMKKVFLDNDVNVLNVSIRHALPDPGSKLAWAKSESFAFVVYYKQDTDEKSKAKVANWTREMIDQVISVSGGYYLPYQPHATDEQFHKAYPKWQEYFEIKNKYDPTDKFTNKLWDKYYNKEKIVEYNKEQEVSRVTANIKDYKRPIDSMYLSIPEWYIIYNAGEYANVLKSNMPSDFKYSESIQEYWRQFDLVNKLVTNNKNNSNANKLNIDSNKDVNSNKDYISLLKVIGASFSVENIIKCIYENTIGRVSERLSDNVQVAEDRLAYDGASSYARFIYIYPWYDFDYAKYFKKIWDTDEYKYVNGIENINNAEQKYTIGQYIRRGERKIFLSLEYGIKSVYAKVIAYITHSKFGVQDDIIYAVVIKGKVPTTDNQEIINAPHYQPFTIKLLSEFGNAYLNNLDYKVIDIAGNSKITLSYVDDINAKPVDNAVEILRNKEIANIENKLINKERITVECKVEDLFKIYKELKSKGISIDHLYDY